MRQRIPGFISGGSRDQIPEISPETIVENGDLSHGFQNQVALKLGHLAMKLGHALLGNETPCVVFWEALYGEALKTQQEEHSSLPVLFNIVFHDFLRMIAIYFDDHGYYHYSYD